MAEPLSDEQLGILKKLLIDRQSELKTRDEDGANWRATVELDQLSVGRLSRMDAMQQQEMARAEARRRSGDLARIDIALNRIVEGGYSWCAECGEPIAFRRLAIDPAAALCIGCAA